MGQIQLVYFSETGFTERYARWIADDLGTCCARFEKGMDVTVGQRDDVLIIGAPVHGGELARKRDIEKLISQASDARIICFATGVAEPREGLAESIARATFRDPSRISLTYLPGGFDPDTLDGGSRALLKALRFMLGRRRDITEEQRLLLDRTAVRGDYADRTQTASLVQEARAVSA